MTTPTTVKVRHRSKAPTVMEIDGFRGRLARKHDREIAIRGGNFGAVTHFSSRRIS